MNREDLKERIKLSLKGRVVMNKVAVLELIRALDSHAVGETALSLEDAAQFSLTLKGFIAVTKRIGLEIDKAE